MKSKKKLCYIKIHENKIKRVIRALEFYKETGYPISKHNEEQHEKAVIKPFVTQKPIQETSYEKIRYCCVRLAVIYGR